MLQNGQTYFKNLVVFTPPNPNIFFLLQIDILVMKIISPYSKVQQVHEQISPPVPSRQYLKSQSHKLGF